MDAAFSSAPRTTFTGSITPALIMSTIFAGEHVETSVGNSSCQWRCGGRCQLITEPSSPAFAGQLANGSFERLLDNVDTDLDFLVLIFSMLLGKFINVWRLHLIRDISPAGHNCLLHRGAGGERASSTRCFFSFISVSVAAPTR